MKNFLRSLRYAWPYRGRLFVSVICAAFAALLWGLTFTGLKPFLEILSEDQNLAQLAASKCDALAERIGNLTDQRELLLKEADGLRALPASPNRDKRVRDLTPGIASYDSDLYWLNTEL